MVKKKVKIAMTVSENGYKRFKMVMKKFGFKNEDMFLRYCTLTTFKKNIKMIKPNVKPSEIKNIDKELKMTIEYGKKK